MHGGAAGEDEWKYEGGRQDADDAPPATSPTESRSGGARRSGSSPRFSSETSGPALARTSTEVGVSAPRCSSCQLSVRFLVFLVLLEAAALVFQNRRAQLDVNGGGATFRGLDHVRQGSPQLPPDVAMDATGMDHVTAAVVQAGKPQGVAAPSRGTLGPLAGCVFIMSSFTSSNWTSTYREAFVQWHADILMRSLGAQTDLRFKALVGPGFTPREIALMARRLRPENFVAVKESVEATATALVRSSKCSWVVAVGVDGDDAVAPFFIHDLHATVRREIRAATRAVRAVVLVQRHLTAVRVDRADGGGVRCRVGPRNMPPWLSGWSVTQGVVVRRWDFIRSGGTLHSINSDHRCANHWRPAQSFNIFKLPP